MHTNSSKELRNIIKIFGMTNQLITSGLSEIEETYEIDLEHINQVSIERNDSYYSQFDIAIRAEAAKMAKNYEVFYCIEKSIRQLVTEIIKEAEGDDWWDSSRVNEQLKSEIKKRIKREEESGITVRSSDPLDFTTFGELSVLMSSNWDLFGGILQNAKAVEKIMAKLNSLRAPIAHCSPLAEDEVLRLHLSLRDWYRQME